MVFDSFGDSLNSAFSASVRFMQNTSGRKDIFSPDIRFDDKAVYFNFPDAWRKEHNYPTQLSWGDIEDMRIVLSNTLKIIPRAGAAKVDVVVVSRVRPLPLIYQVMAEFRKRKRSEGFDKSDK